MKVLLATRQTSDPATGDFCFSSEDELVYRPERCSSPDHPDCRFCGKALAGTRTQYFTNTVKVADKEYFADETDLIHPSIKGLREVAEKYETGSVLEVTKEGILLREGAHIWPEFILDD